MLKLSKLADYATVLMTYLGRHPSQFVSVNAITSGARLPQATVRKLLKLLVKAQLLESQRGTQGGYRLVRQPRDITLLDIIAAIEGEFAITACTQTKNHCDRESYCSMSQNWQVISRVLIQALSAVTLQDLLQQQVNVALLQPLKSLAPSANSNVE